jgi:hypothetical protein
MSEWQDISTAPKGGGAEMVTDPAWIEPPLILLAFEDGSQVIARWDWYYAKGGCGFSDGCAWVEPISGDVVNLHYGNPTHWMPLPPPPKAQ